MAEKVGEEKFEREKGWLLYVKGGDVYKVPAKYNTGEKNREPVKLSKKAVQVKKGHMYYVGSDGFVYEAVLKNAKGE